MSLGVYSNNYVPKEKYSIKNNNPFSSSTDSEGHGSFLEEFKQEEPNDKKIKNITNTKEDDSSKSDLYDYSTFPSQAKINDYIDNFLLINAEQVACTNMTQHLIRSDELKETLGFLNIQAAKNIFQNKQQFKSKLEKTNLISFNNSIFSNKVNNNSSNNIFTNNK